MAPDDNSGARPVGPVVLRIKLRYDDVETMVQRFAPNVGKNGLFLPTKSIQPIGTEVKFELRLANDAPVLVGLGRVKHVKPQDPAAPKAAFGMAIELMRVSREGRELIIKMIERRRSMGLPDVAIPVPEDVDAARRAEAGSQPRGDTSGIVREAIPNFASAPVAEAVLSQPPPTSGPIGVAKPAAKDPEPAAPEPAKAEKTEPTDSARAKSDSVAPAPLLTSPRDSQPIPTATVDTSSGRRAVISLAPERAKPARVRVADLIAKVGELSGPVAAPPGDGLDEHVDVGRALARARALAGSDLEAELAALREVAAAPLEISIEAASAELARQLGGKPIAKRSASAKWVAPPAVEMRTLIDPPARPSADSSSSTAGADDVRGTADARGVDDSRGASDARETDDTRVGANEAAQALAAEVVAAGAAPVEVVAAGAAAPVDHVAAEAAAPLAVDDAAPDAAVAAEAVEAAEAAAPIATVEAPAPVEAGDGADGAADTDEPVAARPARSERLTSAPARDRLTRGRKRKAPEPPPAESLEDPPTVIPEGDPDVPSRDPHAAFEAKTRARTEASPSSVLAALSAVPAEPSLATEPSVPAIEAAADAEAPVADFHAEERVAEAHADAPMAEAVAEAVAEAAAADEPEYGFDEKTRIPTGDDLVESLRARDRRSFSNIDEESLRTEPGQRPSSSLLIEDSADAAMLARAIEGSSPAMRLSDADIEPLDDGDRTQIGQMPASNAFADHGYPTHTDHADQIADQLDRQLADAEAEADNDFRELDAPQPAYQIANQGYVDESQPRPFVEAAAEPYATPEEPGEEISDFDVLAEADEADADLLSAHGEADVAQVSDVPARPSQEDFAARLDLGDDDPASEFEERAYAEPQRRRRASSDISYTVAERVPQSAPPFSARPVGEDFDEPHGFANAKPTTPASLRYAPAAHTEDLEDALAALDVDLEDNALEQQRSRRSSSNQSRPLPGLPAHRPDETGQTQAAKPRAAVSAAAKQAPAPSRPTKGGTVPPPIPVGARKTHTTPPPMPVRTPPKRATTDEGVLIDFDDDE